MLAPLPSTFYLLISQPLARSQITDSSWEFLREIFAPSSCAAGGRERILHYREMRVASSGRASPIPGSRSFCFCILVQDFSRKIDKQNRSTRYMWVIIIYTEKNKYYQFKTLKTSYFNNSFCSLIFHVAIHKLRYQFKGGDEGVMLKTTVVRMEREGGRCLSK